MLAPFLSARQNYGFRCLYVARVAGKLAGYAPAAFHRLDHGSTRRQVCDRVKRVSAESPRAWIYTEGDRCYLDVDGAHGVVHVSRCVDPLAPPTGSGPSWSPRVWPLRRCTPPPTP